MNPHWLFLGVVATTLGVTLAYIGGTDEFEKAYDMLLILTITFTIVGVTLVLTRKHWRDARRLV
jgi:hypothetical protein